MRRLRGCQLLTLMLPIWELKHAPLPLQPKTPLRPSCTAYSLCPSLPLFCYLPCSNSSTGPRNPKGRSAHAALQETTRWVWFRLQQGSHLFWAHLCWLTGKLAARSTGRGPASPVGYQCLTCSPPIWPTLLLNTHTQTHPRTSVLPREPYTPRWCKKTVASE